MKTKTEVSKRERERYEREREAVEDDSFIAPWFSASTTPQIRLWRLGTALSSTTGYPSHPVSVFSPYKARSASERAFFWRRAGLAIFCPSPQTPPSPKKVSLTHEWDGDLSSPPESR